jgi:hypothetical protein
VAPLITTGIHVTVLLKQMLLFLDVTS